MRRFMFRGLMMIVLVLSPMLFFAALLWMERRVRLADLAELYREVWKRLIRGYP